MIQEVRLRRLAVSDVDSAVDYCQQKAGAAIANGFIDAIEGAFQYLGQHPAMGSPSFGYEVRIPGLRSWTVEGFPYLVFYLDRGETLDVLRVLHAQRDIPRLLSV